MKSVKFSHSPLLSQRLPRWRQRVVLAALLGGFGVLVGRAFYLQGIDNEFLGDKGKARFERVLGTPHAAVSLTGMALCWQYRRRCNHCGRFPRMRN